MLSAIRQSAQGFFAKVILVLLIGLFIVWGIGDIFRSSGNASVATVAGTSISMQEYQRSLHNKVEELRQMLGKSYTPELLQKLGVPQQVLSGLINRALMEKEEDALGLVVGDDAVIDALKNDPEFQNADKQFDKTLYLGMLRNRGMTEQHYVGAIRRDMAAELLFSTFTQSMQMPDDLAKALYRARNEQRIAQLLVVLPSAFPAIAPPSEQDIKTYYDTHSASFQTPQYRTLSYIEIRASDVQSNVQVPEEDIHHAYDERAQNLRKPERRLIEQLVFAKESDARKAASALAQGKSFADVARNAPLTNKGKVHLGEVTREQLPQEANIVFALKESQNSPPIQTAFGWHIFYVSKILPESSITYAEARDDIMRELSGKSAQETIYKLVSELEDTLASGSTMEKAAQKIGQTAKSLGPITQEGLSLEGKKVSLPGYENFLTTAFSVPEGEHSPSIQADDGSYFLVHVDKVISEHAKPLAEVRSQIITSWKAEKAKEQLKMTADAIAKDLRGGKSLTETLAAHHIKASIVTSGKLKRTTETVPSGSPYSGKTLPRGMAIELFRLKPFHSTLAYPWTNGGMVIGVLSHVIPASEKTDNEALNAIRKELKDALGNEALKHYFSYLHDKYRVTIADSVMKALSQEGNE